MTRTDHEDAYARCCRDAEARWRWEGLWLPLLRTLAWGLALAALLWMAAAAGDCGDMAHADPAPDAEAFAPPDPEVTALAARFLRWQPTWRPRRAGELETVAAAILAACARDPWPTPERCPDLTTVLVFRESSMHSDAVGRRGELGLMQLLPGVATAGETREAVLDPLRNVQLGLAHLRRAQTMCQFAGNGDVSTALGMYGSGRCRAYRGSRLVERWESELHGAWQ